MNYESINHNLDEVSSSIDALKSGLQNQTEDGLKQELEEMIWHIVAAWNMRSMTIIEASELPDNEFKKLGQVSKAGSVELDL